MCFGLIQFFFAPVCCRPYPVFANCSWKNFASLVDADFYNFIQYRSDSPALVFHFCTVPFRLPSPGIRRSSSLHIFSDTDLAHVWSRFSKSELVLRRHSKIVRANSGTGALSSAARPARLTRWHPPPRRRRNAYSTTIYYVEGASTWTCTCTVLNRGSASYTFLL